MFLIKLLDKTFFSLWTAQRESQLRFLTSYLHNSFVYFQIYNHLGEDLLLAIQECYFIHNFEDKKNKKMLHQWLLCILIENN